MTATAEAPKKVNDKNALNAVVVRAGVSVALFVGQKPVELPAIPITIGDLTAYYLGQFGIDEGVVGMEVRIAEQYPNSFIFNVDGSMNVSLSRDVSMTADPRFKGRIFRQRVDVRKTDDGVLFTAPATNSLRLIEIGLDGQFATYEISLVSQAGRFLLGIQRIYQDLFVRDEAGEVLCPAFDTKWPQFMAVMRSIVADERFNFASASSYKPTSVPKYRPKVGEGRVLWYSLLKGYGAIVTPRGVARVHWSQINGHDIAFLAKGETVAFGSLVAPVETTERGTGFKLEARGVCGIR